MAELRLRAMTAAEFAAYRERSVHGYAAAHVGAGDWDPSQAEALAARELEELLPEGTDTPGMLLFTAEADGAGAVGVVWVELRHRNTTGAWIYDIEIAPGERGRGYGRALLLAAEAEIAKRGVESVALNVFGANRVARALYESSGYEVAALSTRKALRSDDR